MRLKKLYANKKGFKTVKFNETGLNFIVAEKKNKEEKDTKHTYNGVGKSLMVKIIHFCLGSQMNVNSSFCKELAGWVFYLDFAIDGIDYTAKRAVSSPQKIYLNDVEFSLSKFNEELERLCFDIPSGVSFLTFRTLIKFFIRPDIKWYVDFNGDTEGTLYANMLRNIFLLGLDVFIAQKKRELKEEFDIAKNTQKNIKEDKILSGYFDGGKDIKLRIVDLEERIKLLDSNIQTFEVAEDYREVQLKADRVEKELFSVSNSIILMNNNIESINKSLEIEINATHKDIEKIYNEAGLYFSNDLNKTLEELEDFYQNLIGNRKIRLLEQKNKLQEEITDQTKKLQELQTQLDSFMKYLGDHQALDVFLAVNDERNSLKLELDKLIDSERLISDLNEQITNIQKKQIEQTELCKKYLLEIETEWNKLRDYFRNLAKRFYPESSAGLTVSNNVGNNKKRFNYDAKIESDSSDGINHIKIFCYDMTLLFKGYHHRIDFLFHDSRLLDGTDERQKAELFKIINERFNGLNKQYILTANQNQLNEIKDYMDDEEFDNIISSNVVLRLTDENDTGKLLGVTVNID